MQQLSSVNRLQSGNNSFYFIPSMPHRLLDGNPPLQASNNHTIVPSIGGDIHQCKAPSPRSATQTSMTPLIRHLAELLVLNATLLIQARSYRIQKPPHLSQILNKYLFPKTHLISRRHLHNTKQTCLYCAHHNSYKTNCSSTLLGHMGISKQGNSQGWVTNHSRIRNPTQTPQLNGM